MPVFESLNALLGPILREANSNLGFILDQVFQNPVGKNPFYFLLGLLSHL